MTTTTLDLLAAAQQRTRRRQQRMQHVLMGLLALALLGGATKLALTPPAAAPPAAAAELETGMPHGPEFTPLFQRFAQRATALAVVRAPAPRVATRIRRAEAFDPAAFADAVGTVLEEGIASYYGADFEGRPTANGEAFDPSGMTAAHRTLPLGSVIRVTNLRNSRQVIVRVNDRGPYSGDRVLDLSRGAAEVLKMKARGTARIRIEVL